MRPALRLPLAGLLTGIALYLTTFFHELGHLVAGRLMGFDSRFASPYQIEIGGRRDPLEGVIFDAAGPAVSVAIALVGLAICVRRRSSDSIALTMIRGATALTLTHVGVSFLVLARSGGGVDLTNVVAYFDPPVAVRMALVAVGFLLVVVPALVVGRWVLRVDGTGPVRIGRWRPVVAAILAAGQLALVVGHLASMTSAAPTALPSLDLLGALVLLPVIGALLTPWSQTGVRALVRRDAAPIWIAYGLQVLLALVTASPNYAITTLSILGAVIVGIAVAARTGTDAPITPAR